MTRKLRLAWISTYNTRCGIAAYSQHLIENFDHDSFDVMILADDREPLQPDPENVARLWAHCADCGNERLTTLTNHLLAQRYDIAFFQHHFEFFDFEAFAGALLSLHDHGIDTYVTLHKTMDEPSGSTGVKSLRQIATKLATCARVFVHGVHDISRLNQFGLTDNVVLVPHGVVERPPLDAVAVRLLLGLKGFGPVIGSFGFLLPGKGLPALIHAFALVLRRQPHAFLLLINSDYPAPASQEERARCLLLIRQLCLESRVRLINEFLGIEEINFFLSACDVIAYTYEWSEESDSGAVRLGLTAGRPVATTPLPVFSSLSKVVYQLPGTKPADIAQGLGAVLADKALYSGLLQRQREWVRANSWSQQAARIGGIMRGCFEARQRAAPLAAPCATVLPDPTAEARPLTGGPLGRTIPEPVPAARFATATRNAWIPRVRRWRGDRRSQQLAEQARDRRQWAIAARHYQVTLEGNPDNPQIWVQYGHALRETGRFPEAEDAYRKSIELAPDVAETHLQLGHMLKLQSRTVDAAAAYLRALCHDPRLKYAAAELLALGWTSERVERSLHRERRLVEGVHRVQARGSGSRPQS